MKYSILIILLACSVFVSNTVFGQTFQGLGGEASNIIVETSPSQPKPNQFVTVSIESYATDLNRADISWFLNGKLEKQAIGVKTFLLKTGAPGSVSNVLILIKTAEGETVQQVLNIRPSALDLIWEAQSYTPPFHRGKALYTYEGTVKIVAMPNILTENGETINPKTLVYDWKIDSYNVPSVSGYGKNFMFFKGSVPLNSATVSVSASSLDKKYTATGSVILAPQTPFALFYEDHPIYGVLYNKTLENNVTLKNEEIKIVGIPYFFGVKTREGGGLSYEWRLNNQTVGTDSQSGLSFRQQSKAAGTSLISLRVTNPARMFQFANNSLSLAFNQKASVDLFGTQ